MGFFKPNIEKLAARSDIKGLVKALKNKGVYAAAAEALLNIGGAAVPTLIEAMRSNDSGLGKSAAQAVIRFGEVAVAALITALKDEHGGKDTHFLLINSIEGNHLLRAEIRSNVNIALAEIGKAAVPALDEALKDNDKWVRDEAAFALAQIGEAALPVLREVLKDNDFCVRELATQTLKRLEGKG